MGSAELRSTFLSNLPTEVLGISSRKRTSSGSHQRAPGVGVVVIAGCDPGAAALDLAESDTIPGQLLAGGQVGDPDLDPGGRHALPEPRLQLLVLGDPAAHVADRADRRGLGHAPGVE